MDKRSILREIQRTAAENGGRPLGRRQFENVTRIPYAAWHGKYWARWGDAVAEAGLERNALRTAIDTSVLLLHLAGLVRELGRFPTNGELRMKARSDAAFPSHNVFLRLGKRPEVLTLLRKYCLENPDLHDVVRLLPTVESAKATAEEDTLAVLGYVYLVRFGRYFKIGRSNAPGRREYEIALQLPEEATLVHQIQTDDPVGIEAYWHRRFTDKRRKGEWFALSASDVAAFRRRRGFM